MKDMPTEVPVGLTIAAIPEREDPHDALVGAPLAAGIRVGTSSLRRAAQLRALGLHMTIENLRGNVDTRLRKLDEGHFDAIVLAAAGLRRLGLADRIRELISVETMCPAVGQGALAIETRDDDGRGAQFARRLNHAPTLRTVTAERALLATLGGGCQVPIGGYAELLNGTIHLRGIVASPDGTRLVKGEMTGVDPVRLGHGLGEILLDQGARQILEEVYAA
jgi:hydroxymethylbilane synthase